MQSIIVYRNPVEAMFWEGLTSGSFFPYICGIIVFFALFVLIQTKVVEKYYKYRNQLQTNLNLVFSGAVAIFVIWYMTI